MNKNEALRLALEALEYFTDTSSSAMDKAMAEDAITAIKAALEAKDEPVAWFCKERNLVEIDCPAEDDFRSTLGWEPLYSTPPQRKPLTIEQIAELLYKFESASAWYQFARAIEAAHGIKGEA
jgi:hypothetical protein